MKDTKNLTIALLCVSATVLATALALRAAVREHPDQSLTAQLSTALALVPRAYADAPVRGGDYILITGAYSAKTDLLYVIDVAVQKVNTYVFNPQTNELILRDQFNLKPVFGAR